MEELLDKKIRGGLMGYKNGTKPQFEVYQLIVRMKAINVGLYEMFLAQYVKIALDKVELEVA